MRSHNQRRCRWLLWGVLLSVLTAPFLETSADGAGAGNDIPLPDGTPSAYILITEWLSPQERRTRRDACMSCLDTFNNAASLDTNTCNLAVSNPGEGLSLRPWDCRRAYPVRVHPWSAPSHAPPPLKHVNMLGELDANATEERRALLQALRTSQVLEGRGHGNLALIPMGKAHSNEALPLNAGDPIVIISADGNPLGTHYSKITLVDEGHLYESQLPEELWSTENNLKQDCLKGPICHIDPMDYRKTANDGKELPQGTRLRLVLQPTNPNNDSESDPAQLKMILKDSGYWSLLEPMAFYTVPIKQGFFESKATENLAQLNLVAGVNLVRGTRYTQWSLMPERSFFLGVGVSNQITFEGADDTSTTLQPTLIGYLGLSGGEKLNIALGFAPWGQEDQSQDCPSNGTLFLLIGPRLFEPLVSR